MGDKLTEINISIWLFVCPDTQIEYVGYLLFPKIPGELFQWRLKIYLFGRLIEMEEKEEKRRNVNTKTWNSI